MTKVPVTYIDAFAGKGVYGDGEKGSPVISLDISETAVNNSRNTNAKIYSYFIEKKYGIELANSIANRTKRNAKIINGSYEDKIEGILNDCAGQNVFLYVDPFGIKSLHFDKFLLLQKNNYKSIELLLNLNTFGFLREGCRLLKFKYFEGMSEDLEEREASEGFNIVNDIPNMNKVAYGDYWKDIISDYNNGTFDAFEAEERFVDKYCEQLKKVFNYAINIPIKARKLKNMPKYRMVFCTNHKHGLIEMANNMFKRWKQMQEDERNGQMVLFDLDVDFRGVEYQQDYEKAIRDVLAYEFIQYEDLLCKLIMEHGILFGLTQINKVMKELEDNNSIEIIRNPAETSTGNPTKWIDYKKDMKLRLVR
jgi:three-Cys-motif partner protein